MTRKERTRLIEIANKILNAKLENIPDGKFWKDEKGLKISTEDLKFIDPFIYNSKRKVVYTIGAVSIESNTTRLCVATLTRGDDAYIITNYVDEMKFKMEFKEMIENVLFSRTAFKHYKEGRA